MARAKLIVAALGALAFAAGAGGAWAHGAGGLGEAMEVEHARANARAGGPVSARDAELLQRYGCTSGTRNPVCGNGERSDRRGSYRHRKHRRH